MERIKALVLSSHRRNFALIMGSGFLLITILQIINLSFPEHTVTNWLAASAIPDQSLHQITFAVYDNDSVAELSYEPVPLQPQYKVSFFENDSVGEVEIHSVIPGQKNDLQQRIYHLADQYDFQALSRCNNLLADSMIYIEGWDTLSQIRFWQQVISMHKDTAIVSLASNRQVLDTLITRQWNSWPESKQKTYREKLIKKLNLSGKDQIYVTAGKNHYYDFQLAFPTVSKGIEVFRRYNTDPWYAQAILLIESPGKLRYSPVGAYGSFQLMKEVAIEHGLVVNDSIDEREDFDKAAMAAASLIRKSCIPLTRKILKKWDIPYRETDTWFRLLVLHVYHAGGLNVGGVIDQIQPKKGGIELMQKVWTTEYEGFKNASQNYSQIALASVMAVNKMVSKNMDILCHDNSPVLARLEP